MLTHLNLALRGKRDKKCKEDWVKYVECLAEYRDSAIEQEEMCREVLKKMNMCMLGLEAKTESGGEGFRKSEFENRNRKV
tara:strand:+ start:347 stop:586 length:240 start_codon:yes stop_codon:yes gene_type:complete